MKPPTKSEETKLRHLCNSVLSLAQFGNIQNWTHVREHLKLTDADCAVLFNGNDMHCRIKPAQVKEFLGRFYEYRTAPPPPVSLLPDICRNGVLDTYFQLLKDSWNTALEVIEPPKEEIRSGLPPYKKPVIAKLRGPQTRTAEELWEQFKTRKSGLLKDPTGTGKTFIAGRLIRAWIDSGYVEKNSVSPWPILYVTKATVVEQTQRVLTDLFGLDCVTTVHVINIEQLRSKLGEQFIRETTKVVNGEPIIELEWIPFINPLIIIWDECHILKNEGTQQHNIAKNFQRLLKKFPAIRQLFMSATPFMNVAETKVFTLSTEIPYLGFTKNAQPMTEFDWPSWSRRIAAPAHPLEFAPAAMQRYMDAVKDFVFISKNIRRQFKGYNRVELVDFRTQKGMDFYAESWNRFLEECAKINKNVPGGRFLELVALLKHRIAAEYVHATEHMSEDIMARIKAGFSVCVGCSFKPTIAHLASELTSKFGIPRSRISLIWGGDQSLKFEIPSAEEAKSILKKIAMEQHATASDYKRLEIYLKYKEAEPDEKEDQLRLRDLYKTLELGPQSKQDRQKEIDRFQRGKADICIFTFKSGGVGLSLHHTDDLTKEKVRRKESGWAYVEDIPKIPVKPRTSILFPTWSAVELAQGIGRAPRLTSLSDTNQVIMGFRDTVEVKVLAGVGRKLKCLKVVAKEDSESFAGAIFSNDGRIACDYKQIENQVDTSVAEQDEDINDDDEEDSE